MVVLAIAVIDYGLIRVLEPELDPGRGVLDGLAHDLARALLHFDFGESCMIPGCPDISTVWRRDHAADLWLLSGSLVVGLSAGLAGGVVVAMRPRSRRARILDAAATLAFCTPVYVVGFGLLLLFESTFGIWPLPFFFEPGTYAPPGEDPWRFAQGMLVPWLVLAAPVAGAALRITAATITENLGEHYVRTGRAKGLSHRRVVGRHAAPPAYGAVTTYVGVSVPLFITNMVLVEYVFFVPGFFQWTKRALGQDTPRWPPLPDVPMLQALALWAAVLTVLVVVLSEVALAWLDPRVRAASRRRAPATVPAVPPGGRMATTMLDSDGIRPGAGIRTDPADHL
jgi:ABC-type dipeptide/oligopeptide/nickel transport system permease component